MNFILSLCLGMNWFVHGGLTSGQNNLDKNITYVGRKVANCRDPCHHSVTTRHAANQPRCHALLATDVRHLDGRVAATPSVHLPCNPESSNQLALRPTPCTRTHTQMQKTHTSTHAHAWMRHEQSTGAHMHTARARKCNCGHAHTTVRGE